MDLRDALRALLALPDAPDLPAAHSYHCPPGPGPHPAILYCHAHGGDPSLGRAELTQGAPWLLAPYASDLAKRGWAALAIDMPGFGDRQSEGSESALVKMGLWRGAPLFGRMVADQLAGIEWLIRQPEIDSARIVTLGMSMGGALAFWTAALDARVAGAAHLCMLADMAPLIDLGAHDRHGPYLTVPGLLEVAEIGDVAALIAPRPQFVGLGGADPFTPTAAREAALNRLALAYDDGPLTRQLDPETGHRESPALRRGVLDFLFQFQS